jgi:hypothetical protein
MGVANIKAKNPPLFSAKMLMTKMKKIPIFLQLALVNNKIQGNEAIA